MDALGNWELLWKHFYVTHESFASIVILVRVIPLHPLRGSFLRWGTQVISALPRSPRTAGDARNPSRVTVHSGVAGNTGTSRKCKATT